jgi:hypothetical protein
MRPVNRSLMTQWRAAHWPAVRSQNSTYCWYSQTSEWTRLLRRQLTSCTITSSP